MHKLIFTLFTVIFCYSSFAQVSVNGLSAPVDIYPEMAGFNNNTATAFNPWAQTNNRSSWAQSGAPLIRYPGGTVSTYWNHRLGKLFGIGDEIDITTGNTTATFVDRHHTIQWLSSAFRQPNTVPDLAKLYKDEAVDIEVMFVLNMVTPGADYFKLLWNREVNQTPLSDDWWAMMDIRYENALVMLERAEENDIPVKFIEFGNEYFFGQGPSGPGAVDDQTRTGSKVEPYSAGSSNDASIMGAFPGDGSHYADAVNNWAAKLKDRFPNAKLCAIGSDADPSRNMAARRVEWNEKVVSKVDKNLVEAVSFHIYGRNGWKLPSSGSALINRIEEINEIWEEDSAHSKMPKDFDYWFTEFDSHEKEEKTWAAGLITSAQLLNWVKNGNMGLAAFHQFDNDSKRNNGGISAFGRAYSYLGRAAGGSTKARRLKLDGTTTLGSHTDDVQGWEFFENESNVSRYMMINYSSSEKTVNISSIGGLDNKKYFLTSSGLSSTNDPGEQELDISSEITMPPYSIIRFESDPIPTPFLSFTYNGNRINSGDSLTLPNVEVEFTEPVVFEFSVSNVGLEDLLLNGDPKVTLEGTTTNTVELSITDLSSQLKTNESTTFTVSVSPDAITTERFSLLIPSNMESSPFRVNVKVDVDIKRFATLKVTDGTDTLVNGANLDLGNVITASNDMIVSFDLFNNGNKTMTIETVDISGDFTVVEFDSSIPSEGKGLLKLALDRSVLGSKSSQFIIRSDSEVDGIFTYDIEAEIVAGLAAIIQIGFDQELLNFGDTLDLGDFASPPLTSEFFQVKNIGNEPLAMTDMTVSGDVADFKLDSSLFRTDVVAGSSTNLGVAYEPESGGSSTIKIVIESNAEDFEFYITATNNYLVNSSADIRTQSLKVYPTIWDGKSIHLEGFTGNASLQLTSMSGHEIKHMNGYRTDLEKLLTESVQVIKSGIYLINLQTENTSKSFRFIKY